jgi:hypothetical protein
MAKDFIQTTIIKKIITAIREGKVSKGATMDKEFINSIDDVQLEFMISLIVKAQSACLDEHIRSNVKYCAVGLGEWVPKKNYNITKSVTEEVLAELEITDAQFKALSGEPKRKLRVILQQRIIEAMKVAHKQEREVKAGFNRNINWFQRFINN